MATGDMKARLLLDSKEFERGMRKSKRQTQEFKTSVQDMSQNSTRSIQGMLTSFTKIGAVIGAATTAFRLYERVMNSTGSSQITFKARQEGLNAAVDSFFESLNNGDISGFLGRMRTAYNTAEGLTRQLEILQSVQAVAANEGQGFEYKKARAERVIKNPESTKAEIDAAVNDLRRAIEEYGKLNDFIAGENKAAQTAILDEAYTNWAHRFMVDYFPTVRYTTAAGSSGRAWKERETHYFRPYVDKDEVLAIVENTLKSAQALSSALEFNEFANYADKIKRNPLKSTPAWHTTGAGLKLEYAQATAYDQTKMAELLAIKIVQNLTSEERAQYAALQAEVDSAGKKMEDESRAMEELIKGVKDTREAKANAEAKAAEEAAEEQRKAAEAAQEAAQAWAALTHAADAGRPAGISLATNLTLRERVGSKMTERYDATLNPVGELPSSIAMLPGNPAQNALDYMDSQFLKDIEKQAQSLENVNSIVGTLGSSFKELGSSIEGTAGSMLTLTGSTLDAVQALIPLIGYIQAEITMRNANASAAAKEAAAKTLSAYAGIPFAGVAMGVAAIASIIGVMKSIPKFADGGIVNRATLGVFGEAGPEAVMPLDKLEEYITPREMRVTGNIKASGKDLVVVLDNYNRVRNG